MTLHNETLVLDSSSTTTGSDGMNLVLRQGVLRDGDSYIFTLHVTDSSLDGEGAASIMLHYNLPPEGGECHLRGGGEAGVLYGDGNTDGWRIRTLQDRVHFNCSGEGSSSADKLLIETFLIIVPPPPSKVTETWECLRPPSCTACWLRAAERNTARTSASTKAAVRNTPPSCRPASARPSTAWPCPLQWRTTRGPPTPR